MEREEFVRAGVISTVLSTPVHEGVGEEERLFSFLHFDNYNSRIKVVELLIVVLLIGCANGWMSINSGNMR